MAKSLAVLNEENKALREKIGVLIDEIEGYQEIQEKIAEVLGLETDEDEDDEDDEDDEEDA
jgi:hypothetical protein